MVVVIVRPINSWSPFSALKRRAALQQLGLDVGPLNKYQIRVALIHICLIFRNRPKTVPSHSAAVRSSARVTFSRSNNAQLRFHILPLRVALGIVVHRCLRSRSRASLFPGKGS